jgi:hypothetical protein
MQALIPFRASQPYLGAMGESQRARLISALCWEPKAYEK